MKITFIRELPGFDDGRLYRLEAAAESDGVKYDHIISSAITGDIWGTETYLFPADAEGNVIDWCELPGSRKGTTDHDAVLLEAGYVIG